MAASDGTAHASAWVNVSTACAGRYVGLESTQVSLCPAKSAPPFLRKLFSLAVQPFNIVPMFWRRWVAAPSICRGHWHYDRPDLTKGVTPAVKAFCLRSFRDAR